MKSYASSEDSKKSKFRDNALKDDSNAKLYLHLNGNKVSKILGDKRQMIETLLKYCKVIQFDL
ncbi:hypothetical protein V1478_007162 [Vespula squamosa]|uniref:Uncharacterized protein n=1 Tax=Vespula squamosa TaxID=30214 RepID=A0ABD2B2D7_VESSQ